MSEGLCNNDLSSSCEQQLFVSYLHIIDTTKSEVIKVLVQLLHFRPVFGVQTAGEDELSRLIQGLFY